MSKLIDSKHEVRHVIAEVRADQESRLVEGYALLFDTPSDRMPYEEVIDKRALDGVIEKSDIFALLNHDKGRGILARSINGNGSLALEVDERGLKYLFEAPKTSLGDELLENLRRGEITESSFGFTVETDEITRNDDGTIKRVIKKFNRLYDVSPVYTAAYSATNVYARSVEDMERELIELDKRNKEEEKVEVPNNYYEELEEKFK